jgi:NAD(P)-dependent dehydrogenase (short-subunit alcohol dehydrogenase family)
VSEFRDKVAVVTGAAQGIGGAIARGFAEKGAKILIADIDWELATENSNQIVASGGTAEAIKIDVGKHCDVKKMIYRAIELWGRLDILVNNAFYASEGLVGNVENVSEEKWDADFSVILKSIFLAAKYAIPEMRKQGGGTILNMSSVHSLFGWPGFLTYETGKAAVNAITRHMAVEYGPENIRVNAMIPGHIMTETTQKSWNKNPGGLEFRKEMYPLRRCGTLEDLTNAALFLCSDAASFITGHALVIDGGLTLQYTEQHAEHMALWALDHPDIKPPYR